MDGKNFKSSYRIPASRLMLYAGVSLDKIKGAVFPIPHKPIERLLSKERDFFVKFGKYRYLSKGQKIVFYDSDVRLTVGEAYIDEVGYLTSTEVWAKYKQRLFLTKLEFDEYLKGTPRLGPRTNRNGIMTVCLLKNPVRYSSGVKLPKKMTLKGLYLR